tara:strand:+ start:189 stop:1286 length:1098 start_codon:yes stop_codon:yes gene_type:complete
MNKGILLVYNTCTIGGGENLRGWENNLATIQRQNFEDIKVVVSECRGNVKNKPNIDSFINKINDVGYSYNVIYENLPIHITFNHTVNEMVKKFGKFEYYMHVTSGLDFPKDDCLKNIYDYLNNNKDIAVLNLSADNDNVFPPDCTESNHFIKDIGYHMKPGYRVNQHCSVYSNEYYESYDGILRPDIYVGNAVEPTFSYLSAAIGKKYVICPLSVCPPLRHRRTADGGNPGISNRRWFIHMYTEKKNVNGVLIDDIAQYSLLKARLENLGVFIDFPGGDINTNNPFLKPNQKSILDENFDSNGIPKSDEYKNKLYTELKKEFFIKENQKIWIHKVSAPKSVDDFEEKLFNYNNIDNKLKLSKSGD